MPQAQGQAVDQKSAQSDREQATLTKAQIHPDLHDQLKAISESAHTLADLGTPGLEAKFRMPRSAGHGALLTAARQFLKDATPMKAQFLTVNLPTDFLDTLDQTITNFDNATDDQTGGEGGQVSATVGLAGTNATARKRPCATCGRSCATRSRTTRRCSPNGNWPATLTPARRIMPRPRRHRPRHRIRKNQIRERKPGA